MYGMVWCGVTWCGTVWYVLCTMYYVLCIMYIHVSCILYVYVYVLLYAHKYTYFFTIHIYHIGIWYDLDWCGLYMSIFWMCILKYARWITYLVGGLEHLDYFAYFGNNHPKWRSPIFRGDSTTNQIYLHRYVYIYYIYICINHHSLTMNHHQP